jgi:CBS domain-containing protein
MVEYRIRSIPVIDGTSLAGIIAREDVLKALTAAADE